MEYNRSRFEKILDENSNVKEMFIAVRLTKDNDVWEQGYWLTSIERDAVLADEAALNLIVDKVALEGEVALANYKVELAKLQDELPPEEQ